MYTTVKNHRESEAPTILFQSAKGEVGAAIKAGLEVGVTHIDCAWAYLNEPEVGEALHEKLTDGSVKREDLFIASKVKFLHSIT